MKVNNETPPETAATKYLHLHSIPHSNHIYPHEENGGTRVSARELNVPEHDVIKTLVMENEDAQPLIVLMHGDCKVVTQKLAQQIACKKITPCSPDNVFAHTGYRIGGCSPFGTRKALPVYMEKSILDLPLVYINGGKRGFLVGVHPHDVVRPLRVTFVEVAEKIKKATIS